VNTSNWQFAASMVIFTGFLFVAHEFFRRQLKAATVFFFLVVVTLPLWLRDDVEGWFRWAKLLSVLFPICFLNLVRLSGRKDGSGWPALRKGWVFWVLYGVVLLNIIEVSVKDLTLGNYFNGLSGFLLCTTMPLVKAWRVNKGDKADFLVDMPLVWCMLYTTWNACFVFAEHPDYLAHVLCILAVPMAYALAGRRDLWFSARAYTLGISLFVRAGHDFITPAMNSAAWTNPTVLYFWGAANFALHIAFTAYHFSGVYRSRKGLTVKPRETFQSAQSLPHLA
jgi:Family of unknown function (DUF5692)